MLRPTSRTEAERFLDLLADSDFTEAGFHRRPSMQQLPSRHAGNLPWLVESTAEPTPFNMLARLFVFGLAQPSEAVAAVFPQAVGSFLLESGLATAAGGEIVPQAMLTPTEGWVIAADPVHRMHPEAPPDLILWPNQSTRVLQNFALRERCGTLLDFGAGCGVVAVLASPFSERVIATDLNPRGEEFVRFNAWLNGLENIEARTGDGFEPVADVAFDRILANPPFFVMPSSGVMYCENPLELDGFCRQVVRQGAARLKEGGFLQMTFEWVELAGQPWQERVEEWARATGCDLWVLSTYATDPAAYAHERTCNLYSELPETALSRYRGCVDYYREKQVKSIHGGLLALRKRSGANWARIEEGRIAPNLRFDHLVRELFATQDELRSDPDDARLLQLRPRLCASVAIEQQLSLDEGNWRTTSFKLALVHGLPSSLAIEPQVAEFLTRCDGSHTLAELARDLAAKVKAPPDPVRQQCCAVIRKLAERRFISFDASAAATS